MSGAKPTSIKIEMDNLDGGSVWVDVSSDIRNNTPITAEYGIRSSDIAKRIATGGNLSFALNNSWTNASTIRGWYSPDSGSTRGGFAVGTKTRLQIGYGGSTFTKFVGRIDSIEPVAGKRQEQSTRINVVDWMNAAGDFKIRSTIPVQVNRTQDQIITTALSSISEQPITTSLSSGQSTFSYALDSGRSKQTTMLRLLQKTADSEGGYIYVKGDNASGGALTAEDRHYRIKTITSSASLNDTMVKLNSSHQRKRVKNSIRTRVHPRVIDTTASDIFSLDYTPQVGVNNTIIITGEYTDPTNANRTIGGASPIVPIAGTDYTMNTKSEGPGTDITYDQKGRIFEAMTASENLIGYWMLDDAAATTNVKEETDIYRNKYGTACSITFDVSGIGDGRTSASIVGASSYIDIYSSDLNTAFDGTEGTFMGWAKASASEVWADGSLRGIAQLRVDTNNLIYFGKDTAGSLIWQFREGGTVHTYAVGGTGTTWNHMGITWSETASKLRTYHNGAETSSKAFTGAWTGTLNSNQCVIGTFDKTLYGYGWDGSIAHVAIYNEALSAASILGIYNAGSGGFNVDAEIGGFSTEFTITNQDTRPGYITKLQVRGRRVKDFQPITQEAESASSIISYGDLEMFWDMPFQEDPFVGKDAADFFLTTQKDPSTDIDQVEFMANSASELMIAMLDIEPGDRVRIQETVTGIDTDFFVNGVRLKIKTPYNIWCTWYVTPALVTQFWKLEDATYGKLESTTHLVF